MRSTMLPPWLRAESHEHRQLNTLPRCMRPEGDGRNGPRRARGRRRVASPPASAAGVAMLRVLISMRTSIARGLAGKALPRSQVGGGAHCARWVCGSRSRSLRTDLASQTTETPAALRNCRGFRGKGGHDPRANGKGANRFRSTALCPSAGGSISACRTHTKPLHL